MKAALLEDEENDTEELRQTIENLAYKRHSRRDYLEKKAHITDFIEGSLEKLIPEKIQILQHKDERYNKEFTNQEQVELVIRLLYDPTKELMWSNGDKKAFWC